MPVLTKKIPDGYTKVKHPHRTINFYNNHIDKYSKFLLNRAKFYQYNFFVPKEYIENLKFREYMLRKSNNRDGSPNNDFRKNWYLMCKRDILFWINTTVIQINPKANPKVEPKKGPFITYEYQDMCIDELIQAIDNHDLLIEKSRETGASWLCLLVFYWFWQFHDDFMFLMGSRTKDYVDGNQKSLFWKIDFIRKHQPSFMLPKEVRRVDMLLDNEVRNNAIHGESSNPDFGVGDRRSAIFLDEFGLNKDGSTVYGNTFDTSSCRICNSTPYGTGNHFYQLTLDKNLRKVTMHWTAHPVKNMGLYIYPKDNKLLILDKKYKFPKNYKFIRDGAVRSPFYDKRWAMDDPKQIAQHLDISYHGSGSTFFDHEVIAGLIERTARKPLFQGYFQHNKEGKITNILDSNSGSSRAWLNLRRIEKNRVFAMGADISMGVGASPSTLAVGDAATGEKIFEFSSSMMRPTQFAQFLVAVGRWFNNAFMVYENNGGGGSTVTKEVLSLEYSNLYYDEKNETDVKKKQGTKPGWSSNEIKKTNLLSEYANSLWNKSFTNRSAHGLNECKEYVFSDNSTVVHSRTQRVDDGAGKKDNHGDMVIADALLNRAIKQLGYNKSIIKDNKSEDAFIDMEDHLSDNVALLGGYGSRLLKFLIDDKQPQEEELFTEWA